MFVLSRDVSAAKRVIATLLATAIVLWASGAFAVRVQAADLSTVSDLMTDSAPGADSDHTITFELVNDLLNGETVVVDLVVANGFDTTGVTTGDFSITAGAGTFSEAINTGTDVITFTSTGGTVAAGTTVTITINGSNKIANPSTDPNVSNSINGNESYEIEISAGTDSGRTRVVILNTVLVTAEVLSTFNFTVNAVPAGYFVNGTTTDIGSSSTTIPFGTLSAYDKVTIAQNLTVESNAINGFVVTVQSDGNLESSNGAVIDNFEDASDTNVPTAWSSPSVGLAIGDNTTWGHWGITSTDNTAGDLMRDGDEFAANEFIGVSTTPREIFAHESAADAITDNIGSTTVAYQVEISPLQEAAEDYQTTLTYIATPTF